MTTNSWNLFLSQNKGKYSNLPWPEGLAKLRVEYQRLKQHRQGVLQNSPEFAVRALGADVARLQEQLNRVRREIQQCETEKETLQFMLNNCSQSLTQCENDKSAYGRQARQRHAKSTA